VVAVAVTEEEEDPGRAWIAIVVQAEGAAIQHAEAEGRAIYFKVRMSTRMDEVVGAYAMRYNIGVGDFRFLLNGVVLENDHTAMPLGMEDTTTCGLAEDD
jgi:hypothetical protein